MISVEAAKQFIQAHHPRQRICDAELKNALGSVLATDVVSPIDMPPFSQSAMDGYALGSSPMKAGSSFSVVGEAAAGSSSAFELEADQAIRIFTGAAVPLSAAAVVQQEWVVRKDDNILLKNNVNEGMHIRPLGEQMTTGDVALEKGTRLTPAAIGFLAMLGITHVKVLGHPQVKILVTGNELVNPGSELKPGQVYESNSHMLLSALQTEGLSAKTERVPDLLEATINHISSALKENDVVIITGGISVGDHDHVGSAMEHLGVEEVFYKVAQKPGKPIFFGKKGDTAVFALPGNPAASLSCYYEYVLPVLRKSMGHSNAFLPNMRLLLRGGTIRSMGRAQFLKARVQGGEVFILEGQSSAMLHTFALANALVYIPADSPEKADGDPVEVHLLP